LTINTSKNPKISLILGFLLFKMLYPLRILMRLVNQLLNRAIIPLCLVGTL